MPTIHLVLVYLYPFYTTPRGQIIQIKHLIIKSLQLHSLTSDRKMEFFGLTSVLFYKSLFYPVRSIILIFKMDNPLILGIIAATIIGISKGGIKGISVLAVTLMALAYGAKNSTGIILPMLIVGDILAVIYFKKHTKWKYLVYFLPFMLIGVLIATVIGKNLSEPVFKKWMAFIILGSVIFMWFSESSSKRIVPENRIFGSTVGLMAGFTTMIGNLAGPFANLFFLSTKIPKKEFLGTSAWVFFIVNNFKVPFHIFSWETINWDSLKINLNLIPFIIIGFIVGVKIVDYFSEKFFRQFILIVTAIGAILIFIK